MREEIYFSDVGRNIDQGGQFFDSPKPAKATTNTSYSTVDYAAAIRHEFSG